jgi:chromate transporter
LRGVLAGLAAGAAGLILSTAVQMAEPLARQRPSSAHLMAIATFIAVGVLRLNLPLVLIVLGPLSVALAWRSLDAK